jgi:hypothetical protein
LVGEAFSLDSTVAARVAMAKSARRGCKATATENDPTNLEDVPTDIDVRGTAFIEEIGSWT